MPSAKEAKATNGKTGLVKNEGLTTFGQYSGHTQIIKVSIWLPSLKNVRYEKHASFWLEISEYKASRRRILPLQIWTFSTSPSANQQSRNLEFNLHDRSTCRLTVM